MADTSPLAVGLVASVVDGLLGALEESVGLMGLVAVEEVDHCEGERCVRWEEGGEG